MNVSIINYLQFIIVIIIQIYWIIYLILLTNNLLEVLLICAFIPAIITLTSFFIYFILNTIFNIFVPKKWIEKDYITLSFFKKNINNIFYNNLINDRFYKNNYEVKCLKSDDNELNDFQVDDINKIFVNQILDIESKFENNHMTKEIYGIELNSNNDSINKIILDNESKEIADNESKKILDNELKEIFEIKNSTRNKIQNYISNSVKSKQKNNIILTILVPVYDESFEKVLEKTLSNFVDICIDYNKKFDKKINILVCEDGLKAINNNNEIELRKNYYNSHKEIFYIAREKNNRRGKFKKASNINFSMNIIKKVNNENKNLSLLSAEYNFDYSLNDNFELGKYILLIDSDSKMNIGIINNLIYEMISADKKIVYAQCNTSADLVSNNHWEKIIGHFTDSIYNMSFLYSSANGNPTPLVGHNCILDWEQIVNILDKNDYDMNYENMSNKTDYIEYLDESVVSEDFALSLDLYIEGYTGKYIYYDCGFKEGVTLNVDDEITKFSKYSYGVSEILFNPLNEITSKGIFTERANKIILTENIPLHIKLSIISYIGIYYSMAICPLISILNFFLFRFNDNYYKIFKNIFDNVIITIGIFFVLAPISNIITRIRHTQYTSIMIMIFNEIYYDLFLFVFFGGMQYFFLKSFIYHFFNFKLSWSATNKENTNTNIKEKFLKYYDMYFIVILISIGCVLAILYDVKFYNLYSFIPLIINLLLHFIMPIIL